MNKAALIMVETLEDIDTTPCKLAHECVVRGREGRLLLRPDGSPVLRDTCPVSIQDRRIGCAHSTVARDQMRASLQVCEDASTIHRVKADQIRSTITESHSAIVGLDAEKTRAVQQEAILPPGELQRKAASTVQQCSQEHTLRVNALIQVRNQLLKYLRRSL